MSNEKFHRMDFDQTIDNLSRQSGTAQATFFYKLIMNMGPSLCRTIIRYCYERLDRYNATLPDGDPHKERFKLMQAQHKTFLSQEEAENPGIDSKSFHMTLKNDYGQGQVLNTESNLESDRIAN